MTFPTNRKQGVTKTGYWTTDANGAAKYATTTPAPAAGNYSSNGTANANDATGGYTGTILNNHKNFLLAHPSPAAPPAAPAPSLQPGTSFMTGVDMTKPGAAEDYYTQNKDKWTQPTLASQVYQQNKGQLATPGQAETFGKDAVAKYGNGQNPQVSGNSQSNYDQYMKNMPTVATDPGFASYYANAQRQAQEGIDKAMAAQGSYGSAARNDQVSEAFTNLAADRAKNEAGYNLNRLAEQRAWETEGGNLAGQADTVSNMRSANNLSWLQGLDQIAGQGEGMELARLGLSGSMAGAVDSGDLNKLNSGMNASGQAQSAQRERGQDAFHNQMTWGDALSGLMGDNYSQMFGDDKTLLDSENGMGTAGATERQDQAKYATDQNRKGTADTIAIMDLLKKYRQSS